MNVHLSNVRTDLNGFVRLSREWALRSKPFQMSLVWSIAPEFAGLTQYDGSPRGCSGHHRIEGKWIRLEWPPAQSGCGGSAQEWVPGRLPQPPSAVDGAAHGLHQAFMICSACATIMATLAPTSA